MADSMDLITHQFPVNLKFIIKLYPIIQSPIQFKQIIA